MSSWTLAGATIVDGTGAEARVGNVVIEDDRIASVGGDERQGTVVDATGLIAAPGFVDIHSHLDWILPLPDGPTLVAPNVQQGITTSVAGNCGISPAPLGAFSHRDSLVAVHTRGISELFDEAMDEALSFARASRCRLQIAHVNPMGRANWDGIDGLFERVDRARDDGLDIAFDIVGYTAWTMTAVEA